MKNEVFFFFCLVVCLFVRSLSTLISLHLSVCILCIARALLRKEKTNVAEENIHTI